MSSHHFVKEGQELPLIVLAWNNRLAKIASQLLGWQPLFVVEESLVEHVLSLDLKPDVILDPKETKKFDFLAPIDFWKTIPRKENDQHMVLVSWEKNKCVEWVKKHDDILYTDHHKYYMSKLSVFKIWLPERTVIEIFDIQKDKFEFIETESEGFLERKMGNEGFVVIQSI